MENLAKEKWVAESRANEMARENTRLLGQIAAQRHAPGEGTKQAEKQSITRYYASDDMK